MAAARCRVVKFDDCLVAGGFVINQVPSAIALVSSANPSAPGSNVTFTATVSSVDTTARWRRDLPGQ
jgi:hypothetical protein